MPAVTALAGALLGSGVTVGALAGESAQVRPAVAVPSAVTSAGAMQSYAPVVSKVTPSVVLIRTADGLVRASSWMTRATS
jgi:hypothetical protein